MAFDEALEHAFRLWCEQQERGLNPSIEELCGDDPALAAQLRRRIADANVTGEVPTVAELEANTADNTVEISDLQPVDPSLTSDSGAEQPVRRPQNASTFFLARSIPGYELIDELGRGGMGVVYRARHQTLHRIVALKMVLNGEHAGAEAAARFQREVEAVASLQHPGVVQIYEVGEIRGVPFCTLEYCGGGSLATLLADGPLPPLIAARLVEELARTMHIVHQHGIVHRDLKPANILLQRMAEHELTDSGRARLLRDGTIGNSADSSLTFATWCLPGGLLPKISDFGLALRLDGAPGQTRTGEVLGSPMYMSPEQTGDQRELIGPATDVYALGVLLYECLTGRPPFRAATVIETLEFVLRYDPIPPRQLQPGVPRDLDTICLKCLQKEPHKRYAEAKELADDIRRFLNHEAISARRAGRLERMVKWGRRHPATATVAGVLSVALLSILALAFWFTVRLGEERGAAMLARSQELSAAELAEERLFHAVLGQVQRRRYEREPGWKWHNLKDIGDLHRLSPAASRAAELREEAFSTLAATDIRIERTLQPEFHVGCVAWHPAANLIAMGEARASAYIMNMEIRLVDPATDQVVRQLACAPGMILRNGKPLPDGIRVLTFSPDGRWFAAGTRSGRLQVWDLQAPADEPPRRLAAHSEALTVLQFSATGDQLISASGDDGLVCRWAVTGWPSEPAAQRTFSARVQGCSLHPDGQSLVVATHDERLYWLSPDDLKDARPPVAERHAHVQFLPDGETLLSGSPLIRVSQVSGASAAMTFSDPEDPARSSAGNITSLDVTPNGQLIAAGSDDEKHVRLWDTASGRMLADLPIGGGTVKLGFSADGSQLAVAGDREVILCGISQFRSEHRYAVHSHPVRAFSLSGDGTWLGAMTQRNGDNGTLDIWKHAEGTQPQSAPVLSSSIPLKEFSRQTRHQIVFHPEQPVCAFVSGRHLCLYSIEPPGPERRLAEIEGPAELDLDWEPEGHLWLADDAKISIWRPDQAKPVLQWVNQLGKVSGKPQLYSVAAGRTWTVAGSRNGQAYVLRSSDANLQMSVEAADAPLRAAALNPDESIVALGSDKGTIALLEIPGGRRLVQQQLHRDRINAIAWGRSGWLATAARDRTLQLLQWDGSELQVVLSIRFERPIVQLEFHPERNELLLLIDRETAVRAWNLDDVFQQLRLLQSDGRDLSG